MVREVGEPHGVDVGDESLHLVASARAEQAACVLLLQLVVVGDVEGVSVHLWHRDDLFQRGAVETYA